MPGINNFMNNELFNKEFKIENKKSYLSKNVPLSLESSARNGKQDIVV